MNFFGSRLATRIFTESPRKTLMLRLKASIISCLKGWIGWTQWESAMYLQSSVSIWRCSSEPNRLWHDFENFRKGRPRRLCRACYCVHYIWHILHRSGAGSSSWQERQKKGMFLAPNIVNKQFITSNLNFLQQCRRLRDWNHHTVSSVEWALVCQAWGHEFLSRWHTFNWGG